MVSEWPIDYPPSYPSVSLRNKNNLLIGKIEKILKQCFTKSTIMLLKLG